MSDYIQAHCHTNLDDWRLYAWPTCFAALPRVGDTVRSHEGRELKVVRVIHCEHRDRETSTVTPCIEVELHKGTYL